MEAVDVSLAAWEAAHKACPEGTFFQSPAWYRVVAACCGGVPSPLGFRLEDGQMVVVPRLLRRVSRGLVARAECGVEGGYGGVLAGRPLAAAEHEALVRALAARHPDLVFVGNPHAPAEAVPAGPDLVLDATRVIPVLPPEHQLAGFSATRRRHVRLARRAGLRVTVTEAPGPAAVGAFFPLYAAHASRWRYTRWVRDARWFEALLAEGGSALLLCQVWDGEAPVGFQLLALGAGAALQLHLATAPERNALNPGTLLMADTLAALHERGVTALDCLPSGRLAAVASFKESLGARPVVFGRLTRQGWLQRALGVAAACWPGLTRSPA
ncbi:MAG: GNAT family N-acetyltransferase [Candidatus Sericytochromatia bacterium]|nr:GNAT family N-acetyltransferase [Candidatus Sericytochromatia bacterium]